VEPGGLEELVLDELHVLLRFLLLSLGKLLQRWMPLLSLYSFEPYEEKKWKGLLSG